MLAHMDTHTLHVTSPEPTSHEEKASNGRSYFFVKVMAKKKKIKHVGNTRDRIQETKVRGFFISIWELSYLWVYRECVCVCVCHPHIFATLRVICSHTLVSDWKSLHYCCTGNDRFPVLAYSLQAVCYLCETIALSASVHLQRYNKLSVM